MDCSFQDVLFLLLWCELLLNPTSLQSLAGDQVLLYAPPVHRTTFLHWFEVLSKFYREMTGTLAALYQDRSVNHHL